MPSATKPEVQRINQFIAADPEAQRLIQAHEAARVRLNSGSDPNALNDFVKAGGLFIQYLKQRGMYAHDWEMNYAQGLFDQKKGFFERNPWAVALLAGGAAVALPAAVGLAGGAAAPAAAGGTATSAGAAAAGGAAAASAPSLLHSLLPSIIGAGATVGGTALAARSNTQAAQIQADSQDKALAIQKEMWDLERKDNAPYRALGQGGVGNLAYLSGITMPAAEQTPPPVVPQAADPYANAPHGTNPTNAPVTGQAVPRGTLSQLGQPAPAPLPGGMVRVRSPRGTIGVIPASMLPHALAAGGTEVV